MRKTKADIVALVLAAGDELERHEFFDAGQGKAYYRLSDLANATDHIGRADIAEAAHLHGSRQLRGSRAIDNCFENGDGDRVVAELTRRADRNPALHAAIAADFSGTFPASWREALEREPCQLALL